MLPDVMYLVPRASADRPVTGHCVSIVGVPQEIFDFLTIIPGLVIGGPVPQWLADSSEFMARFNAEELHHAEWKITDDPEVIKRWAIDGDTADQGIAALEDHPAVAVGRMYWA